MRWPFAVLAYLFAGLAIVGLVVPGLPTTPFVLLAAWAASRGSRTLHEWLERHPRLGPPLADWRRERAVSTPAKILAVSFLALSWSVMYLRDIADWLLATLAVLFLAVATFILTRPRPSRTGKQ